MATKIFSLDQGLLMITVPHFMWSPVMTSSTWNDLAMVWTTCGGSSMVWMKPKLLISHWSSCMIDHWWPRFTTSMKQVCLKLITRRTLEDWRIRCGKQGSSKRWVFDTSNKLAWCIGSRREWRSYDIDRQWEQNERHVVCWSIISTPISEHEDMLTEKRVMLQVGAVMWTLWFITDWWS